MKEDLMPQVGDVWTPTQEDDLDVEIIGVDTEFVEYIFIFPNPEDRNTQFISDTIENFCQKFSIL